MRKIDLTGQRFSRLVVLRQDSSKRGVHWVCKCDCGAEISLDGRNIRSGHTQSCGCYRTELIRERSITHGHATDFKVTGAYASWQKMKERVDDKEDKRYGGRGISMCDRWRTYSNFYEDMGPRPDGMSIERLDVNGNYEKANCKWATITDQANNKTNTIYIEWCGQRKTLSQWSETTGLPYAVLQKRILVRKWDVERAMTQPRRLRSK